MAGKYTENLTSIIVACPLPLVIMSLSAPGAGIAVHEAIKRQCIQGMRCVYRFLRSAGQSSCLGGIKRCMSSRC